MPPPSSASYETRREWHDHMRELSRRLEALV